MRAAALRSNLAATAALALPLAGSQLARMAISVSDTVIVGRYSVDALAALVIGTSSQFVLFILGSGFAIALMGVLPAALARGDEVEVRRATRMALWLSVFHALAIYPLLWFSGAILHALGQEAQVAALAQQFLRFFGLGIAAQLGAMVMNSYLAALGRPGAVLWITLAGLPVNVALVYAFVFGIGPIPQMGVAGAGIASSIVHVLQFAALWAYALWLPRARRYRLGHRLWRADWAALRRLFRLGAPVGLTLVAETGLFSAVNIMMGWIGTDELAAHGIALQLAALTFMVHLGIASAATIRVSAAAGSGDSRAIADAGRAAIVLSAGFASLVVVLFLTAPGALVRPYLDPAQAETPRIVALAVLFMFWAAMFQLADAMQAVALGLLRGVQDTRVPAVIAAVSYWAIGMPTAYAAAFVLGFGAIGLWMGLLLGLLAAAVLLMTRFWSQRRVWTLAAAAA